MRCYNCERQLEQVEPGYPHRRRDDKPEYKDALHIRLYGGYGEYVDGQKEIILCKICAEQFISQVGWAGLALEFVW